MRRFDKILAMAARFAAPATLIAFVALFPACGDDPAETSGPGGEGGAGVGGSGSGADPGSGGDGGEGLGNIGVGGAPPQKLSCTADLRQVVDEAGKVVKECPADQGCAGGQCVAACEAAASSEGSIGCDFWAPDPPFYGNDFPSASQDGPCYAVFLANAWPRPAKVTIERAGQSFDVTTYGRIPKGVQPSVTYDPVPAEGIPPGEVAILFLAHKPGTANGSSLECPVPPALLEDAAVQGSGRGAAFHVVSDTPVSAYDILPYGGASSYLPSATLLYPSTAWGDNYVAVAPTNYPSGASSGALWMSIVGSADGTTVKVAPPTSLPGAGVIPDAPSGQVTEYSLGRGEILQWVGGDPTGAVVQADKPVGVFTGSTYLGVQSMTSGPGGQDSAHQQIPHVNALGSEYVAPGIVSRIQGGEESVPYRLLGVVDGTALTYEPAAPAGAPSTINAGEVVVFESTELFVVRSQDDAHPFGLTQYMPGTGGQLNQPGCTSQAGSCSLGDEEWVFLLPAKQFLSRYVFFTDPTYGTTNVVLTRAKGPAGFADVNIACLGAVSGWRPVGTSGNYEVAHVDLARGGVGLGSCGTSQHEATSAGAFGVMVWGTDYYASYGYPGGGNFGAINDVVVPPVPK